jgi:hypothetical protein
MAALTCDTTRRSMFSSARSISLSSCASDDANADAEPAPVDDREASGL